VANYKFLNQYLPPESKNTDGTLSANIAKLGAENRIPELESKVAPNKAHYGMEVEFH
jgi:hypothetical protein